jgi:hemolysin-activating ACP:hemolysin acyltransferase
MEAKLVNGVRKTRGLNGNNSSNFITIQQMAAPMGHKLGHVLYLSNAFVKEEIPEIVTH